MLQSSRLQDNANDTDREVSTPREHATPGPMTQSDRFWFDDGNIILQAENTQFRVHRSILSMHSEVMKDCFSLPRPQSEVNIDGCPVVHMTDLAQDVENMCAILYTPAYSHDKNSISAPYLKTMICLGRKYEISFFRKAASDYLQRLFPTTLAEWDAADGAVYAAIKEDKGFLFNVINFAYQYNLRPILPAAVLIMFRYYSLKEILSGVNVSAGETMSVISLQPQALADCIICRTAVLVLLFQYITSSLKSARTQNYRYTIPATNCRNMPECSMGISLLLEQTVMNHGIIGVEDTDHGFLYYPPQAPQHCASLMLKLCGRCIPLFQAAYTGARLDIWTSLPDYFKDPSWNPLESLSV